NPRPNATITTASTVCANSPNATSVSTAGGFAKYGYTIRGGNVTGVKTSAIPTYIAGTGASLALNVAVTNANGCVTNGTKTVTIKIGRASCRERVSTSVVDGTRKKKSVLITLATYARKINVVNIITTT